MRPSASCRGPARSSDETPLRLKTKRASRRSVGGAPHSFEFCCRQWRSERLEKCAVNKMPIGRYLAFVGSLLLAMLFIADWLLPMGPTPSVTSGGANKPVIGIKSDHKWPERIAFDTSGPAIVAQPPVVADASVTHPPREAFALLGAPVPEVSQTPLPVRTKRKVAKPAPHSRWTAYRPAARAEALPAGW